MAVAAKNCEQIKFTRRRKWVW